MSLQESELFYKLNCVSCGVKEVRLFSYKKRVPICSECKKKHLIRNISRILLAFFSVVFGAAIGTVILFSIPISIYSDNPETIREIMMFFIPALISSIVSGILIIISIIISRKFGSNSLHYYKKENKIISVKPEASTDWLSYQDWIKKTLQEKNISENEINTFIDSELKRQEAITEKRTKRGKTFSKMGGFLLFIGIISIIFGIVGPILAKLIGSMTLLLILIQMAYAVPLFVFGIISVVYGRGLKKF